MPAFGLEPEPALIVITCATAIIWTNLVFAVRLFMRCKMNGPFGWDDYACGSGTVVATVYSIVTLVQVHYGYGTSTTTQLGRIMILNWADHLLYILGLGLGKISVAALITRMTKKKEHLAVGYALVSAMVMWIVIPVGLLAFECDLPTPWEVLAPTHCINRVSQDKRSSPFGCHLLRPGGRGTVAHMAGNNHRLLRSRGGARARRPLPGLEHQDGAAREGDCHPRICHSVHVSDVERARRGVDDTRL